MVYDNFYWTRDGESEVYPFPMEMGRFHQLFGSGVSSSLAVLSACMEATEGTHLISEYVDDISVACQMQTVLHDSLPGFRRLRIKAAALLYDAVLATL